MILNKETLDKLLLVGGQLTGIQQAPSGEHFIVLPNGSIQSLAGMMPPTRIRAEVSMTDADSFSDYVNRYKNANTTIFAAIEEGGARLTAVIDYHEAPKRPVLDQVDSMEQIANRCYTEYCEQVGGKAFNGDPLPKWEEFQADPAKAKQVAGWYQVARLSGAKSAAVPTDEVSAMEQPRYCSHLAVLELEQTADWAAWLAADRKIRTQADMAMWLEEYSHMFNHKDCLFKGAELLELITTLYAKQDVSYNSLVRLQTSGFSCNYQEATEVGGSQGGGKFALPPIIQAGLQPFEGGDNYLVSARLKARIENRQLKLWFETVQLQKIIRDSIIATVKKVSQKTGIIPLIGHM